VDEAKAAAGCFFIIVVLPFSSPSAKKDLSPQHLQSLVPSGGLSVVSSVPA